MENIKLNVINKSDSYTKLIQKSYKKSLEYKSNLPDWILNLEGMSGKKYRHFINNLCSEIKDCRYLEIGCWKGSTSCSASYDNDIQAFIIDNWEEFGGPKNEFENNIKRCVDESNSNTNIEFLESDYKEVDYSDLGKYNIYFYDGPHKYEDQYNAIGLAYESLEDNFIFICDDWNWDFLREATRKSIEDLNLKTHMEMEIIVPVPDQNGNVFKDSDWHNGYFIASFSKNKK